MVLQLDKHFGRVDIVIVAVVLVWAGAGIFAFVVQHHAIVNDGDVGLFG